MRVKNSGQSPSIEQAQLSYRKDTPATNFAIGRELSANLRKFPSFNLKRRNAYNHIRVFEAYSSLGWSEADAFETTKMLLLAPFATSENSSALKEIADSSSANELRAEICKTITYKILDRALTKRLRVNRKKRKSL